MATKEIKVGMQVKTSGACAGLNAEGSVDLPEGWRGCVMSLKDGIAGIESKEDKSLVYVEAGRLSGCKGRPRLFKTIPEVIPATPSE